MQFLRALISICLTSLFSMSPAYASDRTVYDFTLTSIDGKPFPLAAYKGKTLLIVNTASKCGFTGQYDGLQQLWEKYRELGLVIIAVPSNDFGKQEPGTAEDIQSFCKSKFNISFPIAGKHIVSGKQAHPLFLWLGESLGKHTMPKWNFFKYLINPEGKAVEWFASTTDPLSARMVNAIDVNLPPRFTLPEKE